MKVRRHPCAGENTAKQPANSSPQSAQKEMREEEKEKKKNRMPTWQLGNDENEPFWTAKRVKALRMRNEESHSVSKRQSICMQTWRDKETQGDRDKETQKEREKGKRENRHKTASRLHMRTGRRSETAR